MWNIGNKPYILKSNSKSATETILTEHKIMIDHVDIQNIELERDFHLIKNSHISYENDDFLMTLSKASYKELKKNKIINLSQVIPLEKDLN